MTIIDVIRWLFAICLILAWLLFASGNAISIIRTARTKTTTSLGLGIGGILGAISLLICPLSDTAKWLWIPLILDIGSIPALLAICYAAITRRSSTKISR